MPLFSPPPTQFGAFSTSTTTTSSAGVTITANATPNTKSAFSAGQLIASTTADAYGILILVNATAGSNASSNTLMDIGTGASGGETVLIPDLQVGWALNENVSNDNRMYYFPIFIPASTRLSARSASVVASKTAVVRIILFHYPSLNRYVGNRVTAYGVDSANSRGTLTTSGNNAYGTAVTLLNPTTLPIHYMQVGLDGGSRTALTDQRAYVEIRNGATTPIVGPLVGSTDTGVESVSLNAGNMMLSSMGFEIPPGIDLRAATMHNTTGASFGVIVYGVD
jgi:hypothetical protein